MQNTFNVSSKLPNVGTNIFTVMSALAMQHNAINLSQGFPNYDCSPQLQDLVTEHMKRGANQYAPMPGLPLLRQRIADKVKMLYDITINSDTEITITAGATQALFTAIAAVVRPGDEVIMLEPAYDSYRPAIELQGGVPVIYELAVPDYAVNWYALERLITPHTKMIIINTPQNPAGRILRAADMMALEWMLEGTDIVVLSDEVYEHLIFDGELHQSVLRFPNLYARCMATYSFGKTFHNTGWKVGYCIAPPALTTEFRKVHQFNVFSVNTPMQAGIADFLATPQEYLQLPDFYQTKRDYLLNVMQTSRFKSLKSEGSYFQLFDYSAISNMPDVAFAKWLTTEHGVAVIPVSVFYSSLRDDKVIRVCFAKTEETLAAAAAILCKL
ncbi:MAG: aminotransferase class I/II-fold pyridoxal phosphate-dependent enzyme [Saprospiraceae bacterium]|nr:aminotransferase class I/II-fold pyridoxal phosphate-dependent enzyme [Saprospiraceae bacterium]MBP7679551.1 aminotransferase class I/II-fold pyridoxal phosphate-dependent enzyme [Saprospiraceae bacterium]